MKDIKIFLLYILDPRGLIEGFKYGFKKMFRPKTMSMILIMVSLVTLFILPKPKGYYVTIFLLIVAFIIQLRIAYIGGDHRYWWKEKMRMKNDQEEKVSDGKTV